MVKNLVLWVVVAIVMMTAYQSFNSNGVSDSTDYTTFVYDVSNSQVKEARFDANEITVTKNDGSKCMTVMPPLEDKKLLDDLLNKKVKIEGTPFEKRSLLSQILISWFPMLFLVGVWIFFMRQMQGGGGKAMSFGKSRAKMLNQDQIKVTFADVAGCDEAKEEVGEVVDFLREPKKFQNLGGKIPKGILMVGPPGTGKTLLAKAIAGEAKVPFFTISGSDFVEMFVGVGASRVRDLFKQAQQMAPCIIFIDEIDAVGRRRGTGMGGGNDEREQTLNQLLIEMDGFDGNENIIVIAATNRSDVLDPALLRPGRFDRKVLVGRPDVKGREAILKVHAKNKPLAEDVDLKVVAQQTPGFVGADLENVLNEAALVAARRGKTKIDASDIDEAEDRVIAGPSKKDRQVSEHERKVVAYHEAGHTIVGLTLSSARDVHKVTIVPRGRAGGYMISLPKEDQMLSSKDELKEQLAGLMGGRVAEEIVFNLQTSGASNDFEQATQLARAMVTEYGMSEKLGPVQYEGNHAMNPGQFTPDKSYSAHTAQLIDEEIRSLLVEAHDRAAEIINANRETHALIAEALLKYETLDAAQIKSIYETGKMPVDSLADSEEDNHALSYDEVKERIENKNKDEEE